MFNTQMLADMRQQNIKEVNADDLVDIRTVSVDTSLPPEQRILSKTSPVCPEMITSAATILNMCSFLWMFVLSP